MALELPPNKTYIENYNLNSSPYFDGIYLEIWTNSISDAAFDSRKCLRHLKHESLWIVNVQISNTDAIYKA